MALQRYIARLLQAWVNRMAARRMQAQKERTDRRMRLAVAALEAWCRRFPAALP